MLQTALKVDWMLQQWGEFQRMETGVIVTTASMGKVVVSGDSDWPASISGVSLATSVCHHKTKRKAVNYSQVTSLHATYDAAKVWYQGYSATQKLGAIIGRGNSQLLNYL